MKDGVGRSGTEKRRRYKTTKARVTDDEKAEILQKAARAGLSEGAYVRAQCLDEPKTRAARRPPIEAELLARTLGQVGKIGSNLNQIAAKLNSGETISRNHITEALAELHEIRAEILRVLGRKSGHDNKG